MSRAAGTTAAGPVSPTVSLASSGMGGAAGLHPTGGMPMGAEEDEDGVGLIPEYAAAPEAGGAVPYGQRQKPAQRRRR